MNFDKLKLNLLRTAGGSTNDKGDEPFLQMVLPSLEAMSPADRLLFRLKLTELVLKFAHPEVHEARQKTFVNCNGDEKKPSEVADEDSRSVGDSKENLTEQQMANPMMFLTPAEQYAQFLGFAAAQEMCRSYGNVTRQLAEGELFAKSNGTERPMMVNPLGTNPETAMQEIAGKVPLGVAENKEQPMASLKKQIQRAVVNGTQQFSPLDLSSTTATDQQSKQVMVDVKSEIDHQPMCSREELRQRHQLLQERVLETIDISDDEVVE